MVRLFQRVVRSFEVGLVVAARCVCVFLMVLRSVDWLRPNVLFSFPSVTNERARARMSAALSSTPRVSVCPRVVVRVGPILCGIWQPRGRPLLLGSRCFWAAAAFGQPLAFAVWCDVRCLGSRVDGVLCATVTAAARLARLRSGAAAVRALPFHNRCCLPVQLAGPPYTTEPTNTAASPRRGGTEALAPRMDESGRLTCGFRADFALCES